ncbi:hypothetical protein KP509_02G089900 [Ceratopteris richardii]|nr:hypothetical protein KP509_02G089900 [Ceratopteris richardii]
MERDKVLLQELMKTAKDLMRDAEVAVRSFVALRSRFARAAGPALPSSSMSTSGTMVPVGGSGTPGSTQLITPTLPVEEFYSGVPIKPSPFLQHTVSRFEHQLQEYRQWVEELERLLFAENDENGKGSTRHSVLQSLPLVLTNIHDFFIHVAAKVETLHQQIWSRRTMYLANQRKKGDDTNPFLEADRREVAKREAAAKRVHPTLQASSTSQISTQAGGLLSAVTPATTSSSGASASSTTVLPGSSSFPGFNTAGTLSSSAASTPFSASSSPLFGVSSAPSPSIFGSTGASTSSLFGSGTSSSLFGSGMASGTTPSLSTFSGASTGSTTGGLFGGTSMPSSGLFGTSSSTGSLFGSNVQPFGSGPPPFGMGTTQGTTATKAKSRTTRRK